MIGIIDYGMGNLRSVEKALIGLYPDTKIINSIDDIKCADKIILPGVGAFGEAMNNLNSMGIIPAVLDHISDNKPFLGICLGFQLLFDESEEFGHTKGLSIIPGKVQKFELGSFKVPHMGWNTVKIKKAGLYNGIADDSYFYFVHSFYVKPQNDDVISGVTSYGDFDFCSSIEKGNVFGVQFHPEKSSNIGCQLLNNFINFSSIFSGDRS